MPAIRNMPGFFLQPIEVYILAFSCIIEIKYLQTAA
jgi:hypothetical protein